MTTEPDVAARRRVRRRSLGRAAVVGLVLGGVGFGSFLVPVPFVFEYLPGPVRDVSELVEISSARTYSSEGSLYLTTVSVDTDVTLVEMLLSAVDTDKVVVLESQVTGGSSLEHLQEAQKREMESSKEYARTVAIGAAGLGRPQGDGARVVSVQQGSPADGVLEQGDVIVAVGESRTATTCDVGAAVVAGEIGETVSVTVEREGRRRRLSLETIAAPSNPVTPYLGIMIEDINYRFESDVRVNFDTGRIAGPSAGLMLSLALYDRLTRDDLSSGRKIAGTGTITCDGEVGPIGGVEQKVAGAEQKGAEVFLSPAANAEAARSSADTIEIVAVSSFQDALDYLEPPS
ncbi:MAG: PDZ domain-containing protein [Actinomycetota bacterium]|nr:PDZ domain-containing protein [Actinomycetota bacterium]